MQQLGTQGTRLSSLEMSEYAYPLGRPGRRQIRHTILTSSPKAGPVDRFGVRVRQRGGRTHAEEPIYG